MPMSWSELERLVDDAEADAALSRALRHCRSSRELLLAARRLGYNVISRDLQRARLLGSAPAVDDHRVACG